jgi:acyl-CoA synthetase (AMP-forming)/AMP-acid ligase II
MSNTIADISAHYAVATTNTLAVRADGVSRSFAELHDRERWTVTALRGLGVKPGDRVGWLALNHIEYVTLWLCATLSVSATSAFPNRLGRMCVLVPPGSKYRSCANDAANRATGLKVYCLVA